MSASHTCALRKAGLYCWGQNFRGQLGNGDKVDSEIPVLASVAGSDVVEVAAATGRTCVRRSTREVACWGANDVAQIGDGTRTDSLTAVASMGIGDAVALAIDDDSTCVLRASGNVACWGSSLASVPESGALLPEPVAGVSDVVELRSGSLGAYCAREAGGAVKCWRLKNSEWTAPAPVSVFEGAQSIAMAGEDELCAIVESGEIVCHNLDSGHTIPLPDSSDSAQIIGTALVICAADGTDQWRCWNVLPPMLEMSGTMAVEVPSAVPVVELAFAGLQACVLREDDKVACVLATDLLPVLRVVDGLPP